MNRDDLKGLKYSQTWVKEQIDKYTEQRERVYGLSQYFDGMPKPQNKPSYALENLIDSYNELLEILAKEQRKINSILGQINMLQPIYRTILTKRYLYGENFETISTEIGYDYYNTCKMHGKALNEFDKLDNLANFDQDLPNSNVLLCNHENLT